MRAALYRGVGPAREVLRVEEVDLPEPARGQVRVGVRVSAVNPTDYKARSGAVPRLIDGFQIPHHDGAGVIDAVGEGVDAGRIGERVWLWLAAGSRYGSAAEFCVVPAEQAVPLPDGCSFDLGASLGVPAMTAHHCLLTDGPISGTDVLVAGGAGAVGHFAIELAKRAGARVVTTVSGPEKARLAHQAGADLVVNYHDPHAADQIAAFASPLDRIVEVALGANLELDLRLSGYGTTIVCYAASGDDPVLPVRRFMTANVRMLFVLLYGVPRSSLRVAAADITKALREDTLTELPSQHFDLTDIAAAHEAAEHGAVGKVLVDL
ncbi:MAG: NADPH:quinone reductase [Nocardioidaceae bacterium]